MLPSFTRHLSLRPEPLHFWSIAAFLAIVAVLGGSSQLTSLGYPIILAVASAAAVAWLLLGNRADARMRNGLLFLGLCALAIGVQLVPLPPSWWSALPGHEPYVAAAEAAGLGGRWRPISVSPDFGWSAFFVLLVPFALLIGLQGMSGRRRAKLMLPLAALIFASGVLGLAQVTDGPDSFLRWHVSRSNPLAVGFFSNRNHQSLLLACSVPLLAALACQISTRPGRRTGAQWLFLGVILFVILMLPSTGSRAGVVLGGIGILLGLAIAAPTIMRLLRKMPRRRRRQIAAGAAVLVAAIVVLMIFLGRNDAFNRITTLDPLNDFRVQALPVVMKITEDFFPFGSGFGTFDIVFRQYEPFELLKRTYFNQAHNDMLQIVLEGGLPALALLAVFIVWWVAATVRAWRAPQSPQALAARAGSAITLLCMLGSFVDYPLRTPLMLAVFTLAAAWMLSPVSISDEKGVPLPRGQDR